MFKNVKNKLQYAALMAPVLAQGGDVIEIKPSQSQWFSLLNLTAGSIISGAISLVLLVVALVFFFMLIWGGLKWVLSQGDQKAVEAARAQITNALIGLAIVFAAFAIMKLIESIFGVSIFRLEIPGFQP